MKGKYMIALVVMVLSFTITIQAKNNSVLGTAATDPHKRISNARELRRARNEYDQLMEKLNQLEARLRDYQFQDASDLSAANNLSADLYQYQILSGFRAVEGPGVTVTLRESPYYLETGEASSFIMYNYDLIVALVNELNSAGAEAIAINGLRYTANTEIYYTSNQLLVDNTPISGPIVIDAIGNPQTMESVLNMRFRVAWHLKENKNIHLEITTRDQLLIPGKEDLPDYQYQYAKPLMESEGIE
ncbi:DUF881 domain-containing protein [Alkaliphilus crotonatoxidans]